MQTQLSEDIGEEIISRLKELIQILENKKQNDKEFPYTPSFRN